VPPGFGPAHPGAQYRASNEGGNMPLIRYVAKKFRDSSLAVITQANDILEEYERQGYDLTLRQLYYQFVARGLIANNDREYKKLGSIVNDARLAGMIDWNHIQDRTRYVRTHPWWATPGDIIKSAAASYRVDIWDDQPEHVEVWVEKDALVGVVQVACDDLRVPYLSCRGYVSQSEMWGSAMRLRRIIESGRSVTLLHMGDHDPSGIDMTRDIEERLSTFIYAHTRSLSQFEVKRIALTMEQVEEYDPPPNPAKLTDARAEGYIARYGYESWELDALDPTTLTDLIRDNVEPYIDRALMDDALDREEREREQLEVAAERWEQIAADLG
jgi:hypothetical protein